MLMSFLRVFRNRCAPCVIATLISSPAAMALSLPSASVNKALQTNKINSEALSAVAIPLNGPGKSAFMNADTLINPASTMKLVTTYAALELLGPSFQWKTEFFIDGSLKDGVLNGNLYLKGGGDPKLNMERLWLLLRDLRAHGVRHVSGNLVLDRNFFLPPPYQAFNDDGNDHSKPFLVEPDSLLVNFKSQRFISRAEPNGIKIIMEPPIGSIEIINNVKIQSAKNCNTSAVNFTPRDDGNTLTLTATGNMAPGCSTQSYLAYLDHPRYAAGLVRSIWQEMGGTILGNDVHARTPATARLLVRSYSPDLAEVIRDINKYSNNTMAKQVFLTIGAQFRTPADSNDAAAARRRQSAYQDRHIKKCARGCRL